MSAEMTVDRPSPVSGFRVLVVDDNRNAARSLGMLFDATGNSARIAYDGPEAIALAAEFRPDLILMDLVMPGLDGCETARRIRELPWGKNVTLVALTGWNRDDIRALAEEAGFDHYFVKPVDAVMQMELLLSHRRLPASL